MARINVLKHDLVPEHQLVDEKEEKAILKELKITKDLLPKINRNDPTIKALEDMHGPVKNGTVIRIIRKSKTAGVSVYYRVVESGVFK